ncbi:MAG TPA: hypothetical protein VEC16_03775 [Alphaproteobacteria bacterium]|nr:hypothetical protein [Alphaproteobacteria bacterium]
MGQVPEVYKKKNGSSTIYYDILDKYWFNKFRNLEVRSRVSGIATLGLAVLMPIVYYLNPPSIITNYENNLQKEKTLKNLIETHPIKDDNYNNLVKEHKNLESAISIQFSEYSERKNSHKRKTKNTALVFTLMGLGIYGWSNRPGTRKYEYLKLKYIEYENGLRVDENGNTLT